jgi:transcriptional regulator of acetoin/glycerol metabolism
LATGPQVKAADLGLRVATGAAARLEEMNLDDVEHHLIQRTLSRYDGNVSQAAKALGLSRSAMYRRLQKHGLE